MKNTIQKITKLVALSAYLVAYPPAFAATPQTDQEHKGAFRDINEGTHWHIGVKLWEKLPLKEIKNRFSNGFETVIGPFVEWKPLHGIGVQTGLMYSYNSLVTAGVNLIKTKSINGWSGSSSPIEGDVESKQVDCDSIKFHAISIPLSIRFYPGSDRQFVLHIGPRIMIPLSKAKQVEHRYISIGNDITKEMMELHSGVNFESANDLKIGIHWTWDCGFAYNTKSGFIIGMNGLGVMLGFDGTKLLSH
ncbi:hypothetical protein ACRRVD_01860 [Candidatus Cardinium hertigii]|uniref:hypothetical protein n=1 Tax=Candidatus Cardinium hertigii TaxID=247481 RepID=UPI003D7CD1D5